MQTTNLITVIILTLLSLNVLAAESKLLRVALMKYSPANGFYGFDICLQESQNNTVPKWTCNKASNKVYTRETLNKTLSQQVYSNIRQNLELNPEYIKERNSFSKLYISRTERVELDKTFNQLSILAARNLGKPGYATTVSGYEGPAAVSVLYFLRPYQIKFENAEQAKRDIEMFKAQMENLEGYILPEVVERASFSEFLNVL